MSLDTRVITRTPTTTTTATKMLLHFHHTNHPSRQIIDFLLLLLNIITTTTTNNNMVTFSKVTHRLVTRLLIINMYFLCVTGTVDTTIKINTTALHLLLQTTITTIFTTDLRTPQTSILLITTLRGHRYLTVKVYHHHPRHH